MAIKKGLGRGLSALLSDSEQEYDIGNVDEPINTGATNETNTPTEISISQIEPNANQPRTIFDEASLVELANSIRLHGVISPLILVKQDNGKYMIIEDGAQLKEPACLLSLPLCAIIRLCKSKKSRLLTTYNEKI